MLNIIPICKHIAKEMSGVLAQITLQSKAHGNNMGNVCKNIIVRVLEDMNAAE